jgi:DNA-binding IclR family transcriptional regulator
MSTSQTLDRGLTALEFVAIASPPPTIEAIASELGVHRSIAYRIVRTLEEHHLVRRDEMGRCHAGARLAALARSVRTELQSAAVEELAATANDLGMTTFLVVRDGDEAVTIESIEPSATQVHVTYKPGIRHRIDAGAPGVAILAAGPACDDERPEIDDARRRGWSFSDGEVVPGMGSIAAPIKGTDASVAVIFLAAGVPDREAIARRVVAAATTITDRLRTTESTTATISTNRGP